MKEVFDIKNILRYRKNDVKKVLAVMFALGVAIMLMGKGSFEEKTEVPVIEHSTEQFYDNTEKRLQEILQKVNGAGKVEVMITYSQSSEIVAAQERRVEENDGSMEEETTYVLKEDGNGTQEIVLTEYMPVPMGVLIVAQGGDNAYVKQALSGAAMALLGVPAHKIEVLKMEG